MILLQRRKEFGLRACALALAVLAFNGCDEDDAPVAPNPAYTVVVTPGNVTLAVGGTQQLTAEARNFLGNAMAGKPISWSSSIPAIATVSSTGLVTMIKPGATTIFARSDGNAYGSAVVSAVAPVSAVAITPFTGTDTRLPIGTTRQLEARAVDADGLPLLIPEVTYLSSAPTIVSVSATGLLTGLAPGNATITASAAGKSAQISVTAFVFTPVNSINLTPTVSTVNVGATLQLTAEAKSSTGATLIDKVIAWTTSDASVATVSQTGLVTMMSAGTAFITASSEGKLARAGVTTGSSALILLSGVDKTALGAAADNSTVYRFYVPPGATALSFTLTGGTGDPDIFIYKPGVAIDVSGNGGGSTCFSFNNAGVAENCTISAADRATTGVWQVQVYAFTTYAGWTLRGTVAP